MHNIAAAVIIGIDNWLDAVQTIRTHVPFGVRGSSVLCACVIVLEMRLSVPNAAYSSCRFAFVSCVHYYFQFERDNCVRCCAYIVAAGGSGGGDGGDACSYNVKPTRPLSHTLLHRNGSHLSDPISNTSSFHSPLHACIFQFRNDCHRSYSCASY